MAWDEWEQIKADVADRGSARTELNSVPPGGGKPHGTTPGGGDLRHSRTPWNHAADVAVDLNGSMRSAKEALDSADKGMSGGLKGLESLSSISTVLASWDTRLAAVRKECQALSPVLRKVARDLHEVDARTGRHMSSVHVPPSGKEPH